MLLFEAETKIKKSFSSKVLTWSKPMLNDPAHSYTFLARRFLIGILMVLGIHCTATAQDLYQLHQDGKIWRYTGPPCSGNSCPGWQMLDNNPATRAIVTSGGQLYQLHNSGKIWRYTGTRMQRQLLSRLANARQQSCQYGDRSEW